MTFPTPTTSSHSADPCTRSSPACLWWDGAFNAATIECLENTRRACKSAHHRRQRDSSRLINGVALWRPFSTPNTRNVFPVRRSGLAHCVGGVTLHARGFTKSPAFGRGWLPNVSQQLYVRAIFKREDRVQIPASCWSCGVTVARSNARESRKTSTNCTHTLTTCCATTSGCNQPGRACNRLVGEFTKLGLEILGQPSCNELDTRYVSRQLSRTSFLEAGQ